MNNKLKKIGYTLFHQILVRVKEYNKDNLKEGSYILCSNHLSDLDGIVYWSALKNIRIMAKKECFTNKILGDFLTKIDVVPVDRHNNSAAALLQALRYLKDKTRDKVYMLFPQGTISDINKNTINRIMPGAFVLSVKSKTPIIPAFIEQPRFFRKNRVVYGESYTPDILNDNGKVDEEKIEKAKAELIEKILYLQQLAIELGNNKPIRKPKLNYIHSHNNDGYVITKTLKTKHSNTNVVE